MKLSIVTPSYNQGIFIQDTIESVLSQNYPDLEYLIMDGGSADITVPMLKTFGDSIIWVSEKDKGQADAVNKGIRRATGEIIGWINSDDIYYPGSFRAVMDVFENNPDINIVYGYADHIAADGSYIEDYPTEKWNYERLKEICFICQPTVFFRKKTAMEYNLLNAGRQYAMDYDFWLKMGKNERFYLIPQKLAGSRLYETNKTLGFREAVHLDIMDTLKETTGTVCDRWIIGSAHIAAEVAGLSPNGSSIEYVKFQNQVVSKIGEYVRRFRDKKEPTLEELPFSYENMHVGIDVSAAACGRYGGTPEYVIQISNALAEIAPTCHFYHYYAFNDLVPDLAEKSPLKKAENVTPLFCDKAGINAAKEVFHGMPEDDVIGSLKWPNVVFFPAFAFNKAIASHTASVYTLFDLSFLEHPAYTTKENYENCFSNVFSAVCYADIFISISEYTKQIFLKYFPHISPERVLVAPLGCKECFSPEKTLQEKPDILGVDTENPFWLTVGTIEPRKNLISLFRAYAELKKQGKTFPLYIAGGKGWLNSAIYEEVVELGIRDDVHFLGFVTDDQLAYLYRKCYATIYPSYYEGFGLPVLEAMTAGAAVISSNTTSLPEVGGEAVLYVDPYDVSSITEAMKRLQENKDLRSSLQQKGLARSRLFSWQECAKQTYRGMFEAIEHFVKRNI